MSEQVGTSATSSGTAQPQTVSVQPKKDKKKPWLMIIAVIVAILLIGSAAIVLMSGDGEESVLELTAEIAPDPIGVGAGASVTLTVNVEYGGDALGTDADVDYLWSVSPIALGSFDLRAVKTVELTAGDAGGTGTVTCKVTYNDVGVNVTASVDITVADPYLASITITPASKTMAPDDTQAFSAAAFDTVGGEMSGVSFTWSVWNMSTSDYTLTEVNSTSVEFTPASDGVALLNASATLDGHSATSSAVVTVTSDVAARAVDYYWYDMFNVPFGSWWDLRWDYYGVEEPLTDSYPYIFRWYGNESNTWYYTNMRLNITGENMPDLNMNENPEFLPFLGTARGGTAEIDWYMQYLTPEEMTRFPDNTADWLDGWVISLNGTVTMDEQAAMSVIGVDAAGLADFDTWWADNNASVTNAYSDWMKAEGNDRLDIYNMYEYAFTILAIYLDAEMVGGKVVLHYDLVTWGMEALMTRWMADSFMPPEWYFEDMNFHATIGPESADIDIDTAVVYAMYAYETTLESEPCWEWEALFGDYIGSTLAHPGSLFDAYEELTYENKAPGSLLYGMWMTYDYTPGVHNLSEGETMSVEWPAGEQMFYRHVEPGVAEEVYGDMACLYSEPDAGDFPGQVIVDETARTITFVGPLDMWTWSKDQATHEALADEWDRLGVLPYGMPTIEFKMIGSPVPTSFRVANATDPVDVGVPSSFDVTVLDQYGNLYPTYTGISHFVSNDTAAELPADYTFTLADAGTHTFVDGVTFWTAGWHDLTAVDTVDATISGSQLNIEVIEPPVADHFVVEGITDPIIPGDTTDVTVTVYDQFGAVYADYAGTVHFNSSDSGAVLPADYAFVPATDAGVHVFSGLSFATEGEQSVTATDTVDAALTGFQGDITVLVTRAADHFVLSDIPDPVMNDTDVSVTVTVYDQYDVLFPDYTGTVNFTSNRTELTLPANYTFLVGDAGVHVFTDELHFTAGGWFQLDCTDTVDSAITGSASVRVVTETLVIDHFTVEGITDMWEFNYSDVTVTAWNQYGTAFTDYDGTVTFSTNATGAYALPADYTFVPATDLGVHVFAAEVMFEEAGVYGVTVEDTVVSAATDTQTDIVIGGMPVATTLSIESAPSSIILDLAFSLTVTVYDQYGSVFADYAGTVTFGSTDGAATLPADYTFDVGDAGTHDFTDEFGLATAGDQDVTATDAADAALTDTVTISAVEPAAYEATYRVYDLLAEPWGEWWGPRWDGYGSDLVISTGTNANTALFMIGGDAGDPTQGIIYAPYRYAVDARNTTGLNVHEPEFMPKVSSTPVPGASATVDIYFQYVYTDWWTNYWWPTWSGTTGFPTTSNWFKNTQDGYIVGTMTNCTLNREAALEWIGLPLDETDPVGWFDDATYDAFWSAWVLDEGNTRLDICYGYEDLYYDKDVFSKLAYDAVNDEVTLQVGHFSWGYEVLMTRWLTECGVSANHEPWYEDFSLTATYGELTSNVTTDGVAQYSMHAVKANGTASGAAWAWEPSHIDYTTVVPAFCSPDRPNEYAPYDLIDYQSWNTGDNYFGTAVDYEYTPYWFNLTEGETLIFELPAGTVAGYDGVGLPYSAIESLAAGDASDFDAIRSDGAMSLGFYHTGGEVLTQVGSTITIEGPVSFDNVRWPGGQLYHGAPWVEFDVAPPKALTTESAPMTAETASVLDCVPAAAAGMTSMAGVVSAVMLTVAAIGGCRRRDP